MKKEIKRLEQKNIKNNTNDEIINELWRLVKNGHDIYVIKEKYKEILEELNKYDNNYYGNICIMLNVMKIKKQDLENLNEPITFQNLKYIRQKIAGEVSMTSGNHTVITRDVSKKVEYDSIDYKEGIGKDKTEKFLDIILKEAEEIISENKLNLDRAKIWVSYYKKYIIITYGRWSKEYEKYMNTTFEIPVIYTSPNILLLAMRETMKKGIKSAIKENKKGKV